MPQLAATSRKVGGKTVDERRAARWRQLVRAAAKVYGERGYRNATVKAVCEAANLTERYFYESFNNSEDLLCACFQEGADELIQQVRRAGLQAGGPPMARVRAAVVVYLRTLETNPSGARVFLIEMSSVSARADALVSKMLDRFGALLVDFLAAGIRSSASLRRCCCAARSAAASRSPRPGSPAATRSRSRPSPTPSSTSTAWSPVTWPERRPHLSPRSRRPAAARQTVGFAPSRLIKLTTVRVP